jgi:hypothetical protein
MIIQPHFETHANPAYTGGEGYTHYEIQTLRDYRGEDGEVFSEPVTDPVDETHDDPGSTPVSPVKYGVYGHCSWGGAEHIVDLDSLFEAQRLLSMMGIKGLDLFPEK